MSCRTIFAAAEPREDVGGRRRCPIPPSRSPGIPLAISRRLARTVRSAHDDVDVASPLPDIVQLPRLLLHALGPVPIRPGPRRTPSTEPGRRTVNGTIRSSGDHAV